MDPVTIATLVMAAEQLIANVYTIINTAGLSPDEAASYVARIQAAQAAVPPPQVG